MSENREYEIKLLLMNAIPERKDVMEEYLNQYLPQFISCDDRPGFVMEAAGQLSVVMFTQRTMHLIWFLGFAAWQAVDIFSTLLAMLAVNRPKLDENVFDLIYDLYSLEDEYKKLIDSAYGLAETNNPEAYEWPNNVPSPDGRKPTDERGGAIFDLICMSGAYVFLHEMKHIALSQDNNAPDDMHDEELECDNFASEMLLGDIESYSIQSGDDLARLKSKRAMAISFALFYLLVFTPKGSWAGSQTHPNICNRISAVVDRMSIPENDIMWLVMSSILLAYLRYLNIKDLQIEFKTLRELVMICLSKLEILSSEEKRR